MAGNSFPVRDDNSLYSFTFFISKIRFNEIVGNPKPYSFIKQLNRLQNNIK